MAAFGVVGLGYRACACGYGANGTSDDSSERRGLPRGFDSGVGRVADFVASVHDGGREAGSCGQQQRGAGYGRSVQRELGAERGGEPAGSVLHGGVSAG